MFVAALRIKFVVPARNLIMRTLKVTMLVFVTSLTGFVFLWQRGTAINETNIVSIFPSKTQNSSDNLPLLDKEESYPRIRDQEGKIWDDEKGAVQTTSPVTQSAPKDAQGLQLLSSLQRPPVLLEESEDIFELLPDEYLPDYKSFCWFDTQDKLQCLPSVYLAGMPKCGTTDLFEKLMWHPEMARPNHSRKSKYLENEEKEFHYWTRLRIGLPQFFLDHSKCAKFKFSKFLAGTGAEQLENNKELRITDGTPSLFWNLEGWETRYPDFDNPPYTNADLIHSVTPDATIIVMFRNPTKRLISEYIYFWDTRWERRTPASFHSEVVAEVTKFNKCLEIRSFIQCCHTKDHSQRVRLTLGLYICYTREWASVFGENLLAITMEEYQSEPVKTLLNIYDHIGLKESNLDELNQFLETSKTSNSMDIVKKKRFGEILEETRKLLNEFYKPYNTELAEYLGESKFLFL